LALAIDRLVGHHRRHDEGAGLLDGLGGAFADQVAVLDRAYAGLDGATHGRVTVRVREHVLADGLGLLDGGAHLGDRVLRRVELVRRGHGAARGHDLDLVHVATKLLARGLADLVDAVGDGADHADAAAHGIDPFGAPALVTVATGPGSAPTVPWRATSLMVSSSTTTAAPSTGSAPVQSITNALVKTVMLIARLFPVALPRHDLGVVHPHLLVGARRPLHRAGHAVEVVLLPEEDPRRLVVDELLQLGVGGRTALGIHHRDGAGDLLVDQLVVAVRRIRLFGQEERLDRALAVQGRPPAEEEQVTGVAV